MKKIVNKCGCLEYSALFNRKQMQFLKHRSYTGVSTGCLKQFRLHYFWCTVIYENWIWRGSWVAVIQLTTNKSHKYRNILTNMSEITEFHKTTFIDILNMLGQGKIWIQPLPKFLTELTGQTGLPKIAIETHAFNLSLCLFEPKMINSVLSGFNLSLLVDIHSLASSWQIFNCSKAADPFFWDKCT